MSLKFLANFESAAEEKRMWKISLTLLPVLPHLPFLFSWEIGQKEAKNSIKGISTIVWGHLEIHHVLDETMNAEISTYFRN